MKKTAKRITVWFLLLTVCLLHCIAVPAAASNSVNNAINTYADIALNAESYDFGFGLYETKTYAAEYNYQYALVNLEAGKGIPTFLLMLSTSGPMIGYINFIRVFQYNADNGTLHAPNGSIMTGVAGAGGFRGGIALLGNRLIATQFQAMNGQGEFREVGILGSELTYTTVWTGIIDSIPDAYHLESIEWIPVGDTSGFDAYRQTDVRSDIAYASTQIVELDGKEVEFQCYALKDEKGNPTNYIKVRDLAYLCNGTPAQFEVGWDGDVLITRHSQYTANGSELSTPFSGDRPYRNSRSVTRIDGQAVDLSAFMLTDDNGGGYTYYKLRDLGENIGFNVGWDPGRGMIFIETDKPYDPSN